MAGAMNLSGAKKRDTKVSEVGEKIKASFDANAPREVFEAEFAVKMQARGNNNPPQPSQLRHHLGQDWSLRMNRLEYRLLTQ